MPTAHILRRSPVYKSFRTDQVAGMFDCQKTEIVQEWSVSLPVDQKPWLIGLIVGASGSGKTTIASEIFAGNAYIHTAFEWPLKAAMLDGFPKDIATKEIVETLSSVGLSSPPHWLKPFAHLSNGQKFRAELARLLLSGHKRVVFDEFTSIVDRDVAKICSATLAKTIRRRQSPQFIAVSCHFDIESWLQPDWVYEVGSGRFEWRQLQRRPDIVLRVYETDVSTWPLFKGHHYLSADISRSAQCFVACWGDQPVAFASVLHFPHPRVRNFKREHRTITLPDFQGVGIGNRLSETIAQHYVDQGFRFVSTTSHPAMIRHRARSPLWRCHRALGHVSASGRTGNELRKTLSVGRLSAGFEFVGGIKPDTNGRHVKISADEKSALHDLEASVVRKDCHGRKENRVPAQDPPLGKAPAQSSLR